MCSQFMLLSLCTTDIFVYAAYLDLILFLHQGTIITVQVYSIKSSGGNSMI